MDKILDEREMCDLECLAIEAFAPLQSYMSLAQYNECLSNLTINEGRDVFPIPIVCGLDTSVAVGSVIVLRNQTGVIHATLTVNECWAPDLEKECVAVFGTFDTNHPYIQYMVGRKWACYVSGVIEYKNKVFHNNYEKYRKTPAEVKKDGPWCGFQTRNPLHRSHIELIKDASRMKVLLHPVEGVTQDCDIPFPVRMKCYQAALPYLKSVSLVILPLSMRMAGPREAVWHAVIRRNYGCTHFIVGRDHAGPSYKTKAGKSFYGVLDAQRLAKQMEGAIGITILTADEVVYCEDLQTYMPGVKAAGHVVKNISGTAFRQMLTMGQDVPEWYSYPEVVAPLKEHYNKPRGTCFYFVGLSGAGKSTLAEALKVHLEEVYPSREVTLLDADIIRTHLSKGLGFSAADRSMNVRRIGYVASEIVRHGGIVIVANIAPYEADRSYNRGLISRYGRYVEFFVDTPIDVCESRDVKGLYKAARAGTLPNFTGVSDPFEIPDKALILSNKPIKTVLGLVNPFCASLLVGRRVLVVSAGGAACTNFIKWLNKLGVTTNRAGDDDTMKHGLPDNKVLQTYDPTHIVYLYSNLDKMIRSLHRRGKLVRHFVKYRNAENRLLDIHEMKYADSVVPFKSFQEYVDVVVKDGVEPLGIVDHIKTWSGRSGVFAVHNEQIQTKAGLDEFLGLVAGTCATFPVLERESVRQPEESDSYLAALRVIQDGLFTR